MRNLLVLVAALCSGCGVETYLIDRGLDLSDVVDFKAGVGLGLGAKVEASDYLGAGLGLGAYRPAVESFGRRFWYYRGDDFLHLVLIGGDGRSLPCPKDDTTMNALFIQMRTKRPPWIDRFRVGGEVLLPIVELGLWLNLGELFDLLCGIANFDPSLDDGLDKGADLFPEPLPATPVQPPPVGPQDRPAQEGLTGTRDRR